MNQRTDYETMKLDTDNNYYWFKRNDVEYAHTNKELQTICDYWNYQEWKAREHSLYYKNTALYFTYKEKKYYLSWTFYSNEMIEKTIKELRKIGAYNIQLNRGELD